MKHIFMLVLMTLVFQLSHAQYTVNGTPVESIDAKYIVATVKGYNGLKVNLEIDYGQDAASVSNKVYLLRDEDDKWVAFKGMAQVFNFLSELGYIYVDTLFSDATQLRILFVKQSE